MESLCIAALSAAYTSSGFAFAAAYWPKIRNVIRQPGAAVLSHSMGAEFTWTACRVISLAYVALVAREPLIGLVVLLDLIGRVALLSVVLTARRRTLSSLAASAATNSLADPAR